MAALAGAILAVAASAAAGPRPDRLERFRELASDRLSAAQVLDARLAAEAYREAYALLDGEIVENLASGSVFASPAFLQDRLDGFSDAWGGAAVRIMRLGTLTVGVFQLGDHTLGNSVRVYGGPRNQAALLTAFAREGRPTVHLLPAPAGGIQFLVAWDGMASERGNRPVQLEVARQQDDGVRVVWTTRAVYPDGLVARSYSVRGRDLRVRYELHYAGWVPGCEGQTEQEDVYRLTVGTGTYARVTQRRYEAWHRDVRASAARLFAALAGGDRQAVAGLVPDVRVRDRLPPRLEPEPVCDATSGRGSAPVSIAASDGHGAPWNLTFRRAGAGWRVTAVSPVVP